MVKQFYFLADPGKARGCSTNIFMLHLLIQCWFVKISLQRRHALMVEDGTYSHKIDYVIIYWFKSYGNFAECVDFAYWWSFSSEGSASADCAAVAGLFGDNLRYFHQIGPLVRFDLQQTTKSAKLRNNSFSG